MDNVFVCSDNAQIIHHRELHNISVQIKKAVTGYLKTTAPHRTLKYEIIVNRLHKRWILSALYEYFNDLPFKATSFFDIFLSTLNKLNLHMFVSCNSNIDC